MTHDHAATVPARGALDPWTVLAQLTDGIVVTDDDGTVGWANPRAAELLMAAPDGLVGRRAGEVVVRATEAGVTVRRDGPGGRVLVLREDVEHRLADLEFLAVASDQLTASLNLDRTLARLVDLAVPRLADGCVASFVENGELRRMGAIARDGRPLVWQERGLSFRAAVPAAVRVRATGVPEVHGAVDPARLHELIPPTALWAPLRDAVPHTALVVPLRARDASIGALVLLGLDDRVPYSARDLDLVESFARRAALSIDNAVTYRDRSDVARLLQESLLPARLPQVPHLELGARYRPMAQGSDIGGDFYDVFPTGDGSWTVAVGDVCGKGVRAATVTGLARHTIRALAAHGRDPADVLLALNDAIRQEHENTYCTVALARTTADARGANVVVVSGGHPPPYLLRADGEVVEVDARGTMIGALANARFRGRTVQLRPGDALVLYTDGVTEARVGGRQFGENRLMRVLASSTALQADTLAERVVQEVEDYAGGVQSDDIAVVVLRARPSTDA